MRLSKVLSCLLVACALSAGFATDARAESASGKIEVTAVVLPNCRLSIAPLLFGEYDPLGANESAALEAATEVRLLCSRDSRATLSLDGGLSASGPGNRQMTNAGEPLRYQIFRDSSRTLPWGEGSDALTLSEFSGTFEPERITVYGRIPAGQQVLSGSYSDVVTAKVDF